MIRKIILSLIVVFVSTLAASAQIKMNSSGNVGIGGRSASDYYDLSVPSIYAGRIFFLGGLTWERENVVTIGNADAPEGYGLYVANNSLKTKYGYADGTEVYVNGRIIATQGLTSSDKRIKRNIKDIDKDEILSKIEEISGRSYKYKKEQGLMNLHKSGKVQFRESIVDVTVLDSVATEDGWDYFETATGEQETVIDVPTFPKGRHFGFIAQEVKKIFPELVHRDTVSKILSVNYEGFIPILWEAVKVQQTQIEDLQAELEELKNSKNTKASTSLDEAFNELINTSTGEVSVGGSTMYQNTPNPGKGTTEIPYKISEKASGAKLVIYNMSGTQLKNYKISDKTGSIRVGSGDIGFGIFLYALVVDGKEIGVMRMVIDKR